MGERHDSVGVDCVTVCLVGCVTISHTSNCPSVFTVSTGSSHDAAMSPRQTTVTSGGWLPLVRPPLPFLPPFVCLDEDLAAAADDDDDDDDDDDV